MVLVLSLVIPAPSNLVRLGEFWARANKWHWSAPKTIRWPGTFSTRWALGPTHVRSSNHPVHFHQQEQDWTPLGFIWISNSVVGSGFNHPYKQGRVSAHLTPQWQFISWALWMAGTFWLLLVWNFQHLKQIQSYSTEETQIHPQWQSCLIIFHTSVNICKHVPSAVFHLSLS